MDVVYVVTDLELSLQAVRLVKDWKTGNVDQMNNIKKILLGSSVDVDEGRLELFHT